MNVICIDVGSPKNIGWANDRGQTGSALTLLDELHRAGRLLLAGERVALGFEAPIWTPRRAELVRITASRGGAEKSLGRAWSAGAGCGALGAALALMPWCFATLRQTSGSIAATTDPVAFTSGLAPLFIWEAFVSGAAKALLHHEDAALAVTEYLLRHPLDPSRSSRGRHEPRGSGATCSRFHYSGGGVRQGRFGGLRSSEPCKIVLRLDFKDPAVTGAPTRLNLEPFQIMYHIEMHTASEEFARCWGAAGRKHIQTQVQGPLHSWLLYP